MFASRGRTNGCAGSDRTHAQTPLSLLLGRVGSLIRSVASWVQAKSRTKAGHMRTTRRTQVPNAPLKYCRMRNLRPFREMPHRLRPQLSRRPFMDLRGDGIPLRTKSCLLDRRTGRVVPREQRSDAQAFFANLRDGGRRSGAAHHTASWADVAAQSFAGHRDRAMRTK